ncbi:MarR family winged helix-turn-helix transcriptional regulator [Tranquillimonas rosea]|uniref:MarR family winged helix-turn-helix transcriptional regulator n=1 Tax=Tranquillimonas rosea TaxID=641238 RepID=UPI003BAB547C
MDTTSDPDPFAADDDPAIGYNRVWFNLLRLQRSMGPRIARELRGEGIDDPVWYEILLELDRAGPEGLPMADLEKRLFTAQYALSRHARRIEAKGWLSRAPRPGRGRGQTLVLTEAGQGVHDRIWPVYERAIRAELGARLGTDEAYDLARLLIRLYP